MVVRIGGSPKSAWVLKLSYLQVKQIKMCHLGVPNSICTEHVHQKNSCQWTCIYRNFLYSKIPKWFREIIIDPPWPLEGL
jgi:hypothetical protein